MSKIVLYIEGQRTQNFTARLTVDVPDDVLDGTDIQSLDDWVRENVDVDRVPGEVTNDPDTVTITYTENYGSVD